MAISNKKESKLASDHGRKKQKRGGDAEKETRGRLSVILISNA